LLGGATPMAKLRQAQKLLRLNVGRLEHILEHGRD
jgi:hypothetical protein